MATALHQLSFENPFYQLPTCFFERIAPSPLREPSLRHINQGLADRLGICTSSSNQWPALTNGDQAWGEPIAMKYMGHQFGHFNPDLGDGRGLLIGQFRAVNGSLQDLHVKGAGQTPFSRQGDGRAVLRSTIREYLISAYLKALQIPTTEALALVSSEEYVQREHQEPAALLVRTADTHIRFGHFEYVGFTEQFEALEALIDYVRAHHYPNAGSVEEWFDQVTLKTAEMIADWQALGFCHGVMNTDNMSITGKTFDFGPYAIMDRYDPHYICNHTDQGGRYAFNQQPKIGLFNCYALRCALATRFAHLCPAMDESLRRFQERFDAAYYQRMQHKLFGMTLDETEAKPFIDQTLAMLKQHFMDYHRFFYSLTYGNLDEHKTPENTATLTQWQQDYAALSSPSIATMQITNPRVILRNGFVQSVISSAYANQWEPFELLFRAVEQPYTLSHATEAFSRTLPISECNGQLSCSS